MRDYSQKKIRREIAPKVFLVLGLAMSALLLTVVLQQLPPRDAVQERISPDFAQVLPAGTRVASNEVELPALPQSSYVVAFRAAEAATGQAAPVSLALVSWDRNAHRFALASVVDLSEGGAPGIVGTVTLAAEPMGVNAPVAITARGSLGAYTDATFVVVRTARGLQPVSVHSPTASGPAYFVSGASAQHGEAFSLGDADGDGDKDAVQESTSVDADGIPHTEVSAYAWNDGAFVYDPELSRVLTLRKSVFPEPEAGQHGEAAQE